jgi:type II restriction enzyme
MNWSNNMLTDLEPERSMHANVNMARSALQSLGLPPDQTNERAALTLLALLDLTPDKKWHQAENPMRGITPLMKFMADHYLDQPYAPNSRETVRRFTMHQFLQAGVVVANPDKPDRAVNSPKFCYQVRAELLSVLRTHGSGDWKGALANWTETAPALVEQWAAAREMVLIPVTLPDGRTVELTPGGQNVLIAALVDQFCGRFTPAGRVLYLGDAGRGDPIDDLAQLATYGCDDIPKHGKIPDLVVLMPDRGWLVLVEAATTHGPIDNLRKTDMADLFACSLGLVFVSAFPDMRTFAKYSGDLAWETDVWVAENPDHLIHFNGERFLGPYE